MFYVIIAMIIIFVFILFLFGFRIIPTGTELKSSTWESGVSTFKLVQVGFTCNYCISPAYYLNDRYVNGGVSCILAECQIV